MSLQKCRECGNEVSTEAEACPHCGAPDPVDSKGKAQKKGGDKSTGEGWGKKVAVGCLSVVGGAFLLSVCFAVLSVDDTDTTGNKGSLGGIETGPSVADVEIVSWNWRADADFGGDGAVIWTAEVQNNASEPMETVRLELTTYDAGGSVLTSEIGYVSGLPPGGRKSTKGYATYFGTEERARLQVGSVR